MSYAQFPFIVSILCKTENSDEIILFGGSAINDGHILTSASRVSQCTTYEIRYDSVTHYTSGQVFGANLTFIHPNFNPVTKEYDVAIIRTSPRFESKIEPIDSTKNYIITKDTLIVASGWGKLYGHRSPVLQFIRAKFKDTYEVDGIFLYARFRGSHNELSYNSGSPLFAKVDADWIQIGVCIDSMDNSDQVGKFASLLNENIQEFIENIVKVPTTTN